MAIIFLIILFLTALIFPKSKFVYITMLVYMWIVFSFNVGAPDRNTYEWIYNENIAGAFEPIFTFLMFISRTFNWGYVGFRMLVAAIYLLFLHLTYKNVEQYKTIALAIYMISPFPWQVSGIRAALACAIVVYAISFLVINPKENRLKFLFFLLMGTLVHYSSILFIILLFPKNRSSTTRIIIFTIISIMITVLFLNSTLLFTIVSMVTDREKIVGWLKGGKEIDGFPNWKGFTAELILLIGNLYFTKRAKDIIVRYDVNGKKAIIAKYIFDINIISILFIPFLRLNDTYARLLFIMHGINIFSYTMAAFALQEKKLQNLARRQPFVSKPKVVFNKFVLIIPLWSYFIAIYQNLPFRGTSMSVLEFLNKVQF